MDKIYDGIANPQTGTPPLIKVDRAYQDLWDG